MEPTMEPLEVAPDELRTSSGLDIDMPLCRGVDIKDMTIEGIRRCLDTGRFSCRQLVECYLERIRRIDDKLRAVIGINPNALEIADRMDQERIAGRVRGPLHGIPYLVKDNIATNDQVATTAGSRALEGTVVKGDADVVALLRQAGAVLMGHANMSQWSGLRTSRYPKACSGRGGWCRNPYDLRVTAAGSSCGSAAATSANMCAFSLGTATYTGIVSPAERSGVVGMQPTLGLVSCRGVIPGSHSFDVVGPIARTVRDAALVLDAIVAGGGGDAEGRYAAAAVADESILTGARFGMPWTGVWEVAASRPAGRRLYRALETIVDKISEAGAEVVTVNFNSAEEPVGSTMRPGGRPERGHRGWHRRGGGSVPAERPTGREQLSGIIATDFYNDIMEYLDTWLRENPRGLRGAQDLIQYDEDDDKDDDKIRTRRLEEEAVLFTRSAATGGAEDEAYRAALDGARRAARTDGVDSALTMEKEDDGSARVLLDGLLLPVLADGLAGARIVAQAGYPIITIPVGMIEIEDVPFGLALAHTAGREETVIRYASAIEHLFGERKTPEFRCPNADVVQGEY